MRGFTKKLTGTNHKSTGGTQVILLVPPPSASLFLRDCVLVNFVIYFHLSLYPDYSIGAVISSIVRALNYALPQA